MNDLEAAAEKAELTGQIRSFMVWLGEGRKLTQTGRIGLADARQLVDALGTGDTIDPAIGGRVHKKNAALTNRPLDLVLALLEAYPRVGKPLFPRNTWRRSLVGDEFAVIGPRLLTTVVASRGPCPMDDLKQVAFEEIAVCYRQVRITLRYVDDPPVWRQVLIPAAYPLSRVRRVIQAAMGREDRHLHAFQVGYDFDFGDGWEHEIVVEARAVAEGDKTYPACIAGEGACPPEDSGGACGFEELKELLA